MITREHVDGFVMIEQHNHAKLSRSAMEHLKNRRLWEDPLHPSVLDAIENHDLGWDLFDRQPFWNDAANAPYLFTNFPTLGKTVLYKHGVDEVEEEDAYAALLCSQHYCQFMNHNSKQEAEAFVQREKKRQQRIIESMSFFDQATFDWHYELLRFADNLSLYICLNNPGTSKEAEHPFFKKGIPVSASVVKTEEEKLQSYWKNEDTIALSPFPFEKRFSVTIREKWVPMDSIREKGILQGYEEAEYKDRQVTVEGAG